MASVNEDSTPPCYDIKSAELSLLSLVLKTTDIHVLDAALARQLGESPGFFENDPVVIDVTSLGLIGAVSFDLANLTTVLRGNGLVPVAIKGAHPELLLMAKGLGMVDGSDARVRRSVTLAEPQEQVTVSRPSPPQSEQQQKALIVDKPLRSGQQVYAKGRDLIVLAMVNAGAEVIADGHIHVYGALRGKAIAGARGDTQAQIFAQVMEPELISIAGVYRTSENALPKGVLGQVAQVRLQSGPEGDKLLITALKF